MKPEQWKRVDALLSAALELKWEQRAAFLAQECEGDEELQRQVEALLKAHEAASSFLEAPPYDAAEALKQKHPAASLDETTIAANRNSPHALIGRVFSHYRLEQLLGEGGMGLVYRATDLKLGRAVAIKLLSYHLAADKTAKARFLREARTASALDHPNIGVIHEIGEQDGELFIVMALYEGETLKQRLEKGALPLNEGIQVVRELTLGLEAAHRAGIVHRDIKPANVMLGRTGSVKILDFGLAKLASDLVGQTVTQPGQVFGTPLYMSPEQLKGEAADARSDLWSLGVVAYELFSGICPFMAESNAATATRILNEQPPSLARVPGVPSWLAQLVSRLLRKNPAERPQTASEVLATLTSVTALAATPVRPAWQTAAVRRATYGAAGVLVLIAVLVGLNVGGWRRRLLGRATSPRIESLAVLPLVNLSGDASQEYFVDGMTEQLITQLAQISALKVISRTSVMRYKGTKESSPQIARALGADALIEGSIRREGDRVQITVQLIDGAFDRHLWAKDYQREMHGILALQGDVASAIAAEVKAKLTPREQARFQQVRSVDPVAYEAYLRGRYYLDKRTGEGFQKALEYFQDAVQKDANSALPYAGLADTYNFLSYFDLLRPQQARPQARAAALKALKLDPDSAEAHTALARVMAEYEWDWQGAGREFQRAIELNPSYAIAHQYYGLYLSDTGRHPEAIAEGKKAVELDPLSLPVMNSLASRFHLARQYDQAIEQFKKVLEMDANFSFAHSNLGWTYVLNKSYEQGTAELLKTISLSGREPEVLSRLGYAYAASGKRSDAQKVLTELNQMASQRYVPPIMMARIYIGLGDQTQALAWLEQSYQDRSLGQYDPLVEAEWDPLRSDPRFQSLLRGMGLPLEHE